MWVSIFSLSSSFPIALYGFRLCDHSHAELKSPCNCKMFSPEIVPQQPICRLNNPESHLKLRNWIVDPWQSLTLWYCLKVEQADYNQEFLSCPLLNQTAGLWLLLTYGDILLSVSPTIHLGWSLDTQDTVMETRSKILFLLELSWCSLMSLLLTIPCSTCVMLSFHMSESKGRMLGKSQRRFYHSC